MQVICSSLQTVLDNASSAESPVSPLKLSLLFTQGCSNPLENQLPPPCRPQCLIQHMIMNHT